MPCVLLLRGCWALELRSLHSHCEPCTDKSSLGPSLGLSISDTACLKVTVLEYHFSLPRDLPSHLYLHGAMWPIQRSKDGNGTWDHFWSGPVKSQEPFPHHLLPSSSDFGNYTGEGGWFHSYCVQQKCLCSDTAGGWEAMMRVCRCTLGRQEVIDCDTWLGRTLGFFVQSIKCEDRTKIFRNSSDRRLSP